MMKRCRVQLMLVLAVAATISFIARNLPTTAISPVLDGDHEILNAPFLQLNNMTMTTLAASSLSEQVILKGKNESKNSFLGVPVNSSKVANQNSNNSAPTYPIIEQHYLPTDDNSTTSSLTKKVAKAFAELPDPMHTQRIVDTPPTNTVAKQSLANISSSAMPKEESATTSHAAKGPPFDAPHGYQLSADNSSSTPTLATTYAVEKESTSHLPNIDLSSSSRNESGEASANNGSTTTLGTTIEKERILLNTNASSSPNETAEASANNSFTPTLLHTPKLQKLETVMNNLADSSVPEESARDAAKAPPKSTSPKRPYGKTPKNIRSWGCNRSETPLIFVHIGKAGGGPIRARFGAGAQNYTRAKWWAPRKDNHYYPIDMPRKKYAKLCDRPSQNHRIPNATFQKRYMEGRVPCVATTPLGMAIACPDLRVESKRRCMGCQDMRSEYCRTIYPSHNLLGAELHWLPPRYLEKWWGSSEWSQNTNISFGLKTLRVGHRKWCRNRNSGRPRTREEQDNSFQDCQVPLAAKWDTHFRDFWKDYYYRNDDSDYDSSTAMSNPVHHYGPIYASLPLQRVTVLREPFSWLMSKFFWHTDETEDLGTKCDDLVTASRANYPDDIGWAVKYSLWFIFYLCGDDCILRFESSSSSSFSSNNSSSSTRSSSSTPTAAARITLQELEAQAEYNLRYSYSVVGRLEQRDEFYDMVSTRVQYLNMSLNPHIRGKTHKTKKSSESSRCKSLYQNSSTFQALVQERIPEVAAMVRLYRVGLEVNQFQREELRQCPNSYLMADAK